MAARVLRGLAAELVGGAARSEELKERLTGHREELLMSGFDRRLQLGRCRSPIEVRTDGEDSILIDFRSFGFARGREPLASRYPCF